MVLAIEPASLCEIASGHCYVDYPSCHDRVASLCHICKQQIWTKEPNSGALRLSFRKFSTLKGYLISASVPKSKQVKRLLCLSCVARHLGSVGESAYGLSMLLTDRDPDLQDAVLFQRDSSGAWQQKLQITHQLLEEAAAADEGGRKRKIPKKSAAESSGRGMQAGKRPRAAPVSW
jgi:hypothetical protein